MGATESAEIFEQLSVDFCTVTKEGISYRFETLVCLIEIIKG